MGVFLVPLYPAPGWTIYTHTHTYNYNHWAWSRVARQSTPGSGPFMSAEQLRGDPSRLCQHASRPDWQQYAKTQERFPGSSELRSVTLTATKQGQQNYMLLSTGTDVEDKKNETLWGTNRWQGKPGRHRRKYYNVNKTLKGLSSGETENILGSYSSFFMETIIYRDCSLGSSRVNIFMVIHLLLILSFIQMKIWNEMVHLYSVNLF